MDWRSTGICPAGAPTISYSTRTSAQLFPGALGSARPYEGIHVVVFLDRVQDTVGPQMVTKLLAYVLVHELTHILEGFSGHSATGIMKARWDQKDYDLMSRDKLLFTAEDVTLIYKGLDDRSAHRVARAAQE
jgi:hypothetical protein